MLSHELQHLRCGVRRARGDLHGDLVCGRQVVRAGLLQLLLQPTQNNWAALEEELRRRNRASAQLVCGAHGHSRPPLSRVPVVLHDFHVPPLPRQRLPRVGPSLRSVNGLLVPRINVRVVSVVAKHPPAQAKQVAPIDFHSLLPHPPWNLPPLVRGSEADVILCAPVLEPMA
eukprot:9481441-Pyramimonas_sp.AAC.1